MARKLGIGIVPWGPMGTGFLTGAITSRADLKDGDFRKAAHGRMTDESFDKACVPVGIDSGKSHRAWFNLAQNLLNSGLRGYAGLSAITSTERLGKSSVGEFCVKEHAFITHVHRPSGIAQCSGDARQQPECSQPWIMLTSRRT